MTVRSDPTPPDAQQRPHQSQDRRRRGDGVAGVAQVAAAAAVREAGDGREHLSEARVIAVCVPDTLTDGLPTCRHTYVPLSLLQNTPQQLNCNQMYPQ